MTGQMFQFKCRRIYAISFAILDDVWVGSHVDATNLKFF